MSGLCCHPSSLTTPSLRPDLSPSLEVTRMALCTPLPSRSSLEGKLQRHGARLPESKF